MDKKIPTFIFIFTFTILSFILTYTATGFSTEVFQIAGEGNTSEIQQLQDKADELRNEATKLRDEATMLRDNGRERKAMKLEDQAMELEGQAMQLEGESHDSLFNAEELLRKSGLDERDKGI